jgi:magnesium chelatase subunit I
MSPEGDIQIRGFKLRLPLDIQFVFTANPEDYTNRGSIVTPLKDRIESQILTHYPKTLEIGQQITQQESHVTSEAKVRVQMHPILGRLIEQIAIEARGSEYVDQKSGVSARLTISALENLYSAAERRSLRAKTKFAQCRISDLWGVIPAITGKIELVYEGEQEGPAIVAQNLIGKAIRAQFVEYFPNPEELRKNTKGGSESRKGAAVNPYETVVRWFGAGNKLDLLLDLGDADYKVTLEKVPGLEAIVEKFQADAKGEDKLLLMEFVLHGLAEFSLIGKSRLEKGLVFQDLMSGLLSGGFGKDDEDEDEDEDY